MSSLGSRPMDAVTKPRRTGSCEAPCFISQDRRPAAARNLPDNELKPGGSDQDDRALFKPCVLPGALLLRFFWQRRLLQVGCDADYCINQRGGYADAKCGADSRLQIEVLGIDADGCESGEHPACSAAN